MLKKCLIVWEMMKALNLQIKHSEYNFLLQEEFHSLKPIVGVQHEH